MEWGPTQVVFLDKVDEGVLEVGHAKEDNHRRGNHVSRMASDSEWEPSGNLIGRRHYDTRVCIDTSQIVRRGIIDDVIVLFEGEGERKPG